MTITAPTLDTITGNTVMVKMRELIKQMTAFAKEVADLVNTIPTDIQDTYSREAIDDMIDGLDSAIATLYDSVYPKSEVYTKYEINQLNNTKQDTLIAGNNITIENNVISAISGSGGMVKLTSGTLSTDDISIAIDNFNAGTYIINLPTFGGIYIAEVVDSTKAIISTKQIESVTPVGGSQATYLLTMRGNITSNRLSFIINSKEISNMSTAWYSTVMPAGTYYEIYYIPTVN